MNYPWSTELKAWTYTGTILPLSLVFMFFVLVFLIKSVPIEEELEIKGEKSLLISSVISRWKCYLYVVLVVIVTVVCCYKVVIVTCYEGSTSC